MKTLSRRTALAAVPALAATPLLAAGVPLLAAAPAIASINPDHGKLSPAIVALIEKRGIM